MVPVILLATLLVVQFSLAYYARTVVAGAAQDAAATAARRDASAADGVALAGALVDEAGGSLLDSYEVNTSTNGDVVTVTVRGQAVSLLPFFGTISVAATSSARIEEFAAQGASP